MIVVLSLSASVVVVASISIWRVGSVAATVVSITITRTPASTWPSTMVASRSVVLLLLVIISGATRRPVLLVHLPTSTLLQLAQRVVLLPRGVIIASVVVVSVVVTAVVTIVTIVSASVSVHSTKKKTRPLKKIKTEKAQTRRTDATTAAAKENHQQHAERRTLRAGDRTCFGDFQNKSRLQIGFYFAQDSAHFIKELETARC